MSGTPRTRRPGRTRPPVARIVLGTLLVSAVVVAAGYAVGVLIGQVLL